MSKSPTPPTGRDATEAPVAEKNAAEVAAQGERLAALQADNSRLREMLAAAGRLAEFGRFAAKQNHELRQPLFAIKGLAQLLLDRDEINVEEVRDFARHIVEQSERLTRLAGDLRHMSMPPPHSGAGTADVAPTLLRVASLLDWRFRKGVTLRTHIAADLPAVALPPHRLEQVLINLLSNALDALAGRPDPIIQVHVRCRTPASGFPADRSTPGQDPADAGTNVEIAIADNGAGVPRTARGRLFEKFFTTKGEEIGTGLGLAVSREIARGVGGELELLEDPSQGEWAWAEPAVTVFRLTLPRASDVVRTGT